MPPPAARAQEHVDELSDEQLDALAGSAALRAASVDLASAAGTKVAAKKGALRLMSILLGDGLCPILLVLLGRQRATLCHATSSPHLKLVGELHDRCHDALCQFIAFVTSHVSRAPPRRRG